MKLVVLGSGSRGNAVAVSSQGVSLLLDAGFGFRTLVKRACQAGISLEQLVAVVLTHEHGDHSRGAAGAARKTGCSVYASPGTLRALSDRLVGVSCRPLKTHASVTVGPFTITCCPTVHDAAEPVALLVSAGKSSIGLAYDLGRPTAAVRYLLRRANVLLLEANHDELMLRLGPYPPVVRDRIAGVAGHLSNRVAGQLLAELCHEDLQSVVLCHLSDRCNSPEVARTEVENALVGRGFRGRLFVAQQDNPLEVITVGAESPQLGLGIAG